MPSVSRVSVLVGPVVNESGSQARAWARKCLCPEERHQSKPKPKPGSQHYNLHTQGSSIHIYVCNMYVYSYVIQEAQEEEEVLCSIGRRRRRRRRSRGKQRKKQRKPSSCLFSCPPWIHRPSSDQAPIEKFPLQSTFFSTFPWPNDLRKVIMLMMINMVI